MPDTPRAPRAVAQARITINDKPVSVHPGPLRSAALHAAGLPKLYDPGYATTAAYTSSITFIDGGRGVLRHRGYPIADLVTRVSFYELAYLLLFSALPTARRLRHFRAALAATALQPHVRAVITAFAPSAHPMSVLIAALAAVGATEPSLNPAVSGAGVYAHAAARSAAITKALGVFPVICAAIYRHHVGLQPAFLPLPSHTNHTLAERFLYLVHGKPAARPVAAALESLLILHADHEQNCSTATVRQLSSSGVDVFSALSGGAAALYGPLHGGACEAVLRMLARIASPRNVPAFLEGVKRREERLMGFGHRIYRNYDPRARIIRRIAYDVFEAVGERDPLVDIATALEKAALADDYFVSRKLYPNVDFYSGVIYKAIGFPPEFYTVLFALGRSAGWVAHWYEFLDDPDRRIARPHQRYVGEVGPLEVPPLEERIERDGPDDDVRKGILAKL